MWVYVERLESGTWVNSGSVKVDQSYIDKFQPMDLVSKMAISEPMRSYLKKSLLKPCVHVVMDMSEVEDPPGLILDKSQVYRFVFLTHKGG